MSASALVVAIAEAEALIGPWRRFFDPSALRAMPAHVTILYPFVEPELITESTVETLRRLFVTASEFDVVFSRLERFDGGVLYLAPAPASPLRGLSELVTSAFPQYPPYGGRYAEVLPHMTICDGVSEAVMDSVASRVVASLPITSRVSDVHLMQSDDREGSWKLKLRLALGG